MASLGSQARSNSRILFASNKSKLVPKNLDPGPWTLDPSVVGFRV